MVTAVLLVRFETTKTKRYKINFMVINCEGFLRAVPTDASDPFIDSQAA